MKVRIPRIPVRACLTVAILSAFALPATLLSARSLAPIDAFAGAPVVDPATQSTSLRALGQGTGAVHMEPRLGVPTFVSGAQADAALRAVDRAPAPKALLDTEATARAYLRDLADLYQISAAEVAALPMHNLQRFPGGGAVVRFRNRIDGVEVFREQANVLVDRTGALVAVGGFVMGAQVAAPRSAAAVTVDAQQAIAAALADYRFPPGVAQELQFTRTDDDYAFFALPAATRSADGSSLTREVRTKRVWFRLGRALVPAHYLDVQVRDGESPRDVDSYAYVVSAVDGSVLYRHNQTADAVFSYRVYAEPDGDHLPWPGPPARGGYPHPTGKPDGFQAPFVTPSLVTWQNAPFSRNDPWLSPAATKTYGNNVEALADLFEPEDFGPAATSECNIALPVDGDLHACTSGPQAFDYTFDPFAPASANRAQVMAAVTNLFYMNNFLHDWYYDAGFDEVSGNAQDDNFGRGGRAHDSIYAKAQDYSGTNNASMSTPPDGQRPTMKMFLWSAEVLARVTAPAVLAGVKSNGSAGFGPETFDVTQEVAVATDATDVTGPSTTDGCTTITNPAALAGRVALIDRGVCTFVVKVKNAQDAGAVGVVIVNNVAPGVLGMSGEDPTITIPSVLISLDDGNAIKAQLAASTPVTVRIGRSGVARDAALSNSTIAHEWGHYISGRLVGDSNGLTSNQSLGMGEGYADFHAMLLLVKDADRNQPANPGFNGVYTDETYLRSGPGFPPDVINNGFYFGIRRFPYSRDITKNPLTFRHIADGVPLPTSAPRSPQNGASANSEVHNTGEIWGLMLWECYSNLLNDSSRLTFAEAQDRMKRYMVAGYKMTPMAPTFVEARDAILAVMAAQDPKDRDLCLAGFAKRGNGLGAVAPAKYSVDNGGLVESYKSVLPASGTKVQAIEYYHAGFDHYFVTHIPLEIAKLDDGTIAGWTRTGESFTVYADFPAGTSGVCRFFSTSFGLKSSHFYTPDINECGDVRQNPNWLYEDTVFGVLSPGPAGECIAGAQPVYRLYNQGQGAAPNHRYTTSLDTRAAMMAKGWIPEGNGDVGVVMCSPV